MKNKKIEKSTYVINAFYYTAMPFLRGFLSFLILPVMTRHLTPDNYGVISLLTMLSTFSWMFCLGLNSASYRLYFKYKDNIQELKKLLSTNLFFIFAASLFYGVIVSALFPFFNHYFFKSQLKIIWLLLALSQFTLVYLNTINQDILKIQQKGKKWFFNEFFAVIIMTLLSVILVLTRRFTFEAIIIANLAAESAKFIISFLQLRQYYVPVFSKVFLKESFIYSWPQTPSGLIGFVYSYFDKILLSRFQGLLQVGILDISSRFSLLLKTSMDGISGVFSPVAVELLMQGSKESLKKLADICLKLVFLILFLALCLILFSQELILLLTAEEYHFAIYVAPIYIYYQVFAVLGMVAYWLIYYHPHKTFWQIPINVIGLVSNTTANIILIPKYGIMGAAMAIFFSSGLAQVIQLIIGLKIIPIPINNVKLLALFSMVFFETGVLYYLYYLKSWFYFDLVVKIFLLVLFFCFGIILKIFHSQDLKHIVRSFLKTKC